MQDLPKNAVNAPFLAALLSRCNAHDPYTFKHTHLVQVAQLVFSDKSADAIEDCSDAHWLIETTDLQLCDLVHEQQGGDSGDDDEEEAGVTPADLVPKKGGMSAVRKLLRTLVGDAKRPRFKAGAEQGERERMKKCLGECACVAAFLHRCVALEEQVFWVDEALKALVPACRTSASIQVKVFSLETALSEIKIPFKSIKPSDKGSLDSSMLQTISTLLSSASENERPRSTKFSVPIANAQSRRHAPHEDDSSARSSLASEPTPQRKPVRVGREVADASHNGGEKNGQRAKESAAKGKEVEKEAPKPVGPSKVQTILADKKTMSVRKLLYQRAISKFGNSTRAKRDLRRTFITGRDGRISQAEWKRSLDGFCPALDPKQVDAVWELLGPDEEGCVLVDEFFASFLDF